VAVAVVSPFSQLQTDESHHQHRNNHKRGYTAGNFTRHSDGISTHHSDDDDDDETGVKMVSSTPHRSDDDDQTNPKRVYTAEHSDGICPRHHHDGGISRRHHCDDGISRHHDDDEQEEDTELKQVHDEARVTSQAASERSLSQSSAAAVTCAAGDVTMTSSSAITRYSGDMSAVNNVSSNNSSQLVSDPSNKLFTPLSRAAADKRCVIS